MKYLFIAVMTLVICSCFAEPCDIDGVITYEDKVYINDEEMKAVDDAFFIHIGENRWIKTHAVNKDKTGLFTYAHNICRVNNLNKLVGKHWKCPYCFQYWPEGSPCKNEYCPSRYK